MAWTNEVKICPPTVDIELCDWTIAQEKALPTKIVGVVYTKKCPWDSSIDPEVVCVSNDWGLTVSKAVAVFDTSVNPPTVELYDFNNTLLTGYTVVKCDDAWYDIEKGWDFCLSWQLITRYDIIDAETQLVVGSYWVDALGVNQATPVIWDLSARPCEQLCNLWSVGTISSWWVIL